jgi:cell division protein FtsL
MASKRRVAPRRRSTIALLLVGFVLVATGVIARRVWGVRQQTEIRKLRQVRDGLEADRVRLEGAIRDASSRSRLQPIAEQRLNMHIAKPEQQVFIPRGASLPTPDTTRAAARVPHGSL